MRQMIPFAREDDLPSWFANSIQFALSVLSSQLQVYKLDNTHVKVDAGVDDLAVVVWIAGKWRWVEAPITVAHPGGAAGSYPIFVTAQNNNIVNVPDPFTDITNYAFGIAIRPPGATPPIVAGVVDIFRQVGVVVWDGVKITRVVQSVPASPSHADQHAIGGKQPLSPADIGAPTLAAVENLVPPPPQVSALPGAPADGDEVYFVADEAAGVLWHLRYDADSGSAHKWEYLGGPPLNAETLLGGGPLTVHDVYTDVPGANALTVPLAGDYDVQLAVVLDAPILPGGGTILVSFRTPGVSDLDAGVVRLADQIDAASVFRRKLNLAGGTDLVVQMRGLWSGDRVWAADPTSGYRWTLQARPVRVG